jgi:hypothetical protein
MSIIYNLQNKMARLAKRYKLDTVKIQEVATAYIMKHTPRSVTAKVKEKFDEAHQQLLDNFESHEVTREIEAGPDGENISGTLGGRGNLFSFIGFYQDSNPLAVVRSYLKDIRLNRKPNRKRSGKKRVNFEYSIEAPGKKDTLFRDTKLSWLGKSWLKGIESGLSGLGSYIYWWSGMDFPPSRSGSGVQEKDGRRIRSGAYRPTKYISSLLSQFSRDLRKK